MDKNQKKTPEQEAFEKYVIKRVHDEFGDLAKDFDKVTITCEKEDFEITITLEKASTYVG
jgi:hypothetical protein